jgi:hypothetical protein
MTVAATAAALNVAPSTLHRWLNGGLIAGEQDTPGAPWRIRLTAELKARFTEAQPETASSPCRKRHVLSA